MSEQEPSIAQRCFNFCGLFEAEVLVELALRYWEHPLADDKDFRTELLERATEALRTSMDGQPLVEELQPENMNFIAAMCFAEWSAIDDSGPLAPLAQSRRQWLDRVRRAIPSCFCNPDMLG